MKYLQQKANTWVSMAVLAGGMVSALLLMWIVKIEATVQITSTIEF